MKCSNCGAEIEKMTTTCPYCSAINYKGAGEQYRNVLNHIQKEMVSLEQKPKETLKKEVAGHLAVTALAITFSVLAGLCVYKLSDDRGEIWQKKSDQRVRDRIAWEEANYPQMEEWYRAGDFEALLELYNQEEQNAETGFYRWKYWKQLQAYDYYTRIVSARELLQEGKLTFRGELTHSLEAALCLCYEVSAEDMGDSREAVEEFISLAGIYLEEDLEISREQGKKLYDACVVDGYFSYTICSGYADEIMDKMGLLP